MSDCRNDVEPVKKYTFLPNLSENREEVGGVAVTLYPHNETAYRNALQLMEQSGRAAVIHPTGTGKSFIAFKLAEEHPTDTILWLAPGEYIFQSQRENYRKAGGEESILSNITFLT